MPFGSPFDAYHREIIAPTALGLGLKPLRADEINSPGVILNQIWKGIQESLLCIADVTGRNANVMYELGLAHAIGKPVVQLAQNIGDLPFDLRSFRHIIYRTELPRWERDLEVRLRKMLSETLADPKSSLVLNSVSGFQEPTRDAALLMVMIPVEADRRMRTMIARLFKQSRSSNSTLTYQDVISTVEAEVTKVREEAKSLRKVEREITAGAASRIENILTEFSLDVMNSSKDVDLIQVLRRVTDKWAPTESSVDDSDTQHIDISRTTSSVPQKAKEDPSAEVHKKIQDLVHDLENFHSNPEGIYYIGRSLVRTHSLLADLRVTGEPMHLTNELLDELDSDTRKDEGLFDPVISVGKVTRLIKHLKTLTGQWN